MSGGPNALAYIAIVAWSIACFFAPFALSPARAVAYAVIGGGLLLPQDVGWDLPLLPPLTSYSLPSLCVLLGLLVFRPASVRRRPPLRGFDWFVVALLVGSIGTVLTNGDAREYALRTLPGLDPYDWISQLGFVVFTLGIPYYLGRAFFRTQEALKTLFVVVLVAALLYSLLALYELRMSPQLHRQLYGFHQQSFRQAMRGDGYRPMVFMAHGLALANFFFGAGVIAFALARDGVRLRGKSLWPAAAWLSVLLVGLRSLGALLLGGVAYPLVLVARPRVQVAFAAALSLCVASYFLVRAADLLPTQSMVALASAIDEDRGLSLDHRLRNETALFDKARERIVFGWGARGRNRIYDDSGRDITDSDGYWMIMLGREGAVGLACRMALFLGPVWLVFWRWNRVGSRLVAALAVLLAFRGVDMIPNANIYPLGVILAGALAGSTELRGRAPRGRRAEAPRADAAPPPTPRAPAAAPERPAAARTAAPGPRERSASLGAGLKSARPGDESSERNGGGENRR